MRINNTIDVITGVERDLKSMAWIADQYAIRMDLLSHLLREGGVSEERTRQVAKRWESERWIHRKKLLADQPAWVWPTAAGMRAAELEWRAVRPSLSLLGHTDAVASVRLYCERHWTQGEWVCERRLFRDFRDLQHIPDGIWARPEGDTAVEVDLTQKSAKRLEVNLASLRARWPTVFYVGATPAIVEAVSRIAADDPAIRIVTLSNIDPRNTA